MPTAGEFDQLAGDFDRLALEADEVMAEPSRIFDGHPLVGGRLTRDMADLLVQCRSEMTLAALELRGAAAECRRRAMVCRAWATALAHWRHEVQLAAQARADWSVRVHLHQLDPLTHPAPGPAPQDPERPPRPAPWAEL